MNIESMRLRSYRSFQIDDAELPALAADPMATNNNVSPLQGEPGYRLRIGDWRVLYEIDHQQRCLRVRHIVSRGEDYKP